MEQLNEIHLRGHVGNVRTAAAGDVRTVTFSVATNFVYHDGHGSCCIETTWHNVVANRSCVKNPDGLRKGAAVDVIGRIRQHRYTGTDGVENVIFEVVGHKVEVLETSSLSLSKEI